MRITTKRVFAWLLTLCMIMTMIPIAAAAAEEEAAEANTRVYYSAPPVTLTTDGTTNVTASIMNSGDTPMLFVAAAYESDDIIADAGAAEIPAGDTATDVNIALNGEYSDVRYYLWNENTLEPFEALAAFPGAEGGGMYALGARAASSDNIEVYHVTRLDDDRSNPTGTFRDAVSQSNRVIVFDVAGNIELTDTLTIKGSNLTILGQTAPGDGICVKNANTSITGNNVIMRYMRFRMGDSLTMEEDTIGSRSRNNIIIDHCTFSWCVDECVSIYENTNCTVQYSIISESLKESVHGKGSHGYGGIWGGQNVTFHHNLLADHDSRNPRLAAGRVDAALTDGNYTLQTDLTDMRNNVIYNWGGNSAYGGQNGAPANIVNCYYKYGPATKSSVRSRIFQLTYSGNDVTYEWGPDIYVSGNYVYGNSTVTNDNTQGIDGKDSSKKYYIWSDSNMTEDAKTVHNRYESLYPVTTETAEEAYNSVLESAGASIVRDSIDTRIIDEVKNGTASCGTNGLINTPSDAGGYPELSGTKSKDSDNDGIPNEWEDKNGLNKLDKSDGTAIAANGYMNIENYANALADGSYVRDTDYDPDVPDYDPTADATPTPSVTATPAPVVELVDSWTATKGDESKTAGTEFMPGLSGVIQLSTTKSDTKTYSDGAQFTFAITSKTNGGWDATTGTATGCAMKYTAPESGRFTLYAYGVTVKTPPTVFYAVKEGVSDPTTDHLFSEDIDEDSKPVLCSIDVEQGQTYYFYIAGGSKARFCGAKLERYVTE